MGRKGPGVLEGSEEDARSSRIPKRTRVLEGLDEAYELLAEIKN